MSTPTYRTRVTRLSVLPEGEPLFSEQCTTVSIEDEAAGEFVKVEQFPGGPVPTSGVVLITPEEWPVLRRAISRMIGECGPNHSGLTGPLSMTTENQTAPAMGLVSTGWLASPVNP